MRQFLILCAGVCALSLLSSCSFFDPLSKYDSQIQKTPRLSQVFKDDFKIGAAVEPAQLVGPAGALLRAQYNIITPENAMKFTSIHPEENRYDFTAADAIANFARKNGMKIRGHTFVWHHENTIAKWMFFNADGTKKTREEALSMLESHMRTIMTRYKDVVYAWDVVNEAFDLNVSDGMRRSPWYDTIGPDYVEKAFEIAHKIDPKAKLFYNETNMTETRMIQYVSALVRDLKAKGIQIDGIGIQMHITLAYPEMSAIERMMKACSELGVEVNITEMDMSLYTQEFEVLKSAPEKYLVRQAWRYRQLFDLFRKYKNVVTSVTTWGMYDGATWLIRAPYNRGDWPLLFDANFQGKLAFTGLTGGKLPADVTLEPEKNNQIYTAGKGTPAIDGKIDAVWNKAAVISTNLQVMAKPGAVAKVRALWDKNHVYILAEVTDPVLNKASKLVHERDSFEAFIDENNGKTNTFEKDDFQYRVAFDGEKSFGGSATPEMLKSKAVVTATGYIVEMAINLNTTSGAPGKKIGLEFQVNDADATAARVGISKWNDTTNESWRNTSGWGTLEMAE